MMKCFCDICGGEIEGGGELRFPLEISGKEVTLGEVHCVDAHGEPVDDTEVCLRCAVKAAARFLEN